MLCMAFSKWLLSLSTKHLRFFPHVFSLCNSLLHLLVLNNIFLCGWTRAYSFTWGRTSWLLPSLGDYEQSCDKYLYVDSYVDISFPVHLNTYQGMHLLDWMIRICLVLSETTKMSSKIVVSFAFPPVMDDSSCSKFLVAFAIVSVPNFGHSNRCIELFHCYFNLHFPNDIQVEYLFICLFSTYISSLVRYLKTLI